MNPTKKRLSIINQAISMTDNDTIQLQILKLKTIQNDEKLDEILTALQAESYGKVQSLIAQYIDEPTQAVHQRAASIATSTRRSEAEQAIIDEFELFDTAPAGVVGAQNIDIDAYFSHKSKTKQPKTSDLDVLLELKADDVLRDTLTLDASTRTIMETQNDTTPRDTFFDAQNISESEANEEAFFEENTQEEMTKKLQEDTLESTVEESTPQEPNPFNPSDTLLNDAHPFKELKQKTKKPIDTAEIQYKAMAYIEQKFSNMKKQYLNLDQIYAHFDSVENLLSKIIKEGYSEKEIEETLAYIKTLTEQNQHAQAAQLLLLCAGTESLFAQFMLARELYKGELFAQNIPESFLLMSGLALEDYPEALCDLGQFYEHGVGTTHNIKKAKQLYKEAAEAGIKRAQKHHARFSKDTATGFMGL